MSNKAKLDSIIMRLRPLVEETRREKWSAGWHIGMHLESIHSALAQALADLEHARDFQPIGLEEKV